MIFDTLGRTRRQLQRVVSLSPMPRLSCIALMAVSTTAALVPLTTATASHAATASGLFIPGVTEGRSLRNLEGLAPKPVAPSASATGSVSERGIPAHLIAQSVWQTFSPSEGGFSILMPGVPTPLGASFEVKGIPLNLRQFVASQQNDTVVYMAGWLDLPPTELREVSIEASLDSVQEGFRSRLNGDILHSFAVKLSGNPGRHYKMNAWVDNRPYSVTQRVYLKDNRIYQLTAMVPRRIEFDLTRSVQGFLKSFQFVSSAQARR